MKSNRPNQLDHNSSLDPILLFFKAKSLWSDFPWVDINVMHLCHPSWLAVWSKKIITQKSFMINWVGGWGDSQLTVLKSRISRDFSLKSNILILSYERIGK